MVKHVVLVVLLYLASILNIYAQEDPFSKIGSGVPVLSEVSKVARPVESPDSLPINGGLLWSEDVSNPTEVEWIKLNLNFSNFDQIDNWFLIIRDSNGKVADSYNFDILKSKSDASDIWSEKVSGKTAKLELYGNNITKNNFKIRVEKYQFSITKSAKYSVIGAPNFEDITKLGQTHAIYKAGKPIARLEFVNEYDHTLRCTGFLINDEILMTNEHCINSTKTCNNTKAYFGHETGSNGTSFNCKEYIYSSEPLDFSLIRLVGKPGFMKCVLI